MQKSTVGVLWLLTQQSTFAIRRFLLSTSWRVLTLPTTLAIYSLWTANNYVSWVLASIGKPPIHYSKRTEVSKLQGDVEEMQLRETQHMREIQRLRQELYELKKTKKQLVVALKQSKRQVAEMHRQLQLFQQWTACQSGEDFALEYSLAGRLGLSLHVSVLLAAVSVWSLHGVNISDSQQMLIVPAAVLGSWWYIWLLLATRISRWHMQVVYCIAWGLVGFAINERLRMVQGWPTGFPLFWPVSSLLGTMHALVREPVVALATWVVGGYNLLQDVLVSVMPSSIIHHF